MNPVSYAAMHDQMVDISVFISISHSCKLESSCRLGVNNNTPHLSDRFVMSSDDEAHPYSSGNHNMLETLMQEMDDEDLDVLMPKLSLSNPSSNRMRKTGGTKEKSSNPRGAADTTPALAKSKQPKSAKKYEQKKDIPSWIAGVYFIRVRNP